MGEIKKDTVQQIINNLIDEKNNVEEIIIAYKDKKGENFLSLSCSEDLMIGVVNFIVDDLPSFQISTSIKNTKLNS
jgi:hypothetical protein